MSDEEKAKVNTVNEALEKNKEIEKMVKQVLSSSNASKEQKLVFSKYFQSCLGLNHLLGEKYEQPVTHNNKQTKDIRDRTSKINKKKHVCNDCDVKFTSASALAAHTCSQSMETSSEPGSEVSISNDSNQCHICSKICSNTHNLKQHLQMHANDPNKSKESKRKRGSYKKKFSCEHCGKEVTTLSNLNKHIDCVHKDIIQKENSEKQVTSEDENVTNSTKNKAKKSRKKPISENETVTNSTKKKNKDVDKGESSTKPISENETVTNSTKKKTKDVDMGESSTKPISENETVTNSTKKKNKDVDKGESSTKQISGNETVASSTKKKTKDVDKGESSTKPISENETVTNSTKKKNKDVDKGESSTKQISENETVTNSTKKKNKDVDKGESSTKQISGNEIVTNSTINQAKDLDKGESRQKQISRNYKTNQEQSKTTEEISNNQQLDKNSNSNKSSVPVIPLGKNVDDSVSASTSGKHKVTTKEFTSKKKIKCDSCHIIFDSQAMFDVHIATCISKLFTPEKNVCCNFCPEKFFNVGALTKHKQHFHNTEHVHN